MRALWTAVVMQAANDLTDEAYGSLEYAQAWAFFTGDGEWAHSRTSVADCIGVHADDLMRYGRRLQGCRAARDGGPRPAVKAHAPARPGRIEAPPSRPVSPPCMANMTSTPLVRPAHLQNRPRRVAPPPRERNWWIERFLAKQEVG